MIAYIVIHDQWPDPTWIKAVCSSREIAETYVTPGDEILEWTITSQEMNDHDN